VGLTVHYKFEFQGTETEAIQNLKKIEKFARKLPFKEVSRVAELDYNFWSLEKYHKGKGYNDWRDWACIQYEIHKQKKENGRSIFFTEKPVKAYCLHLWPGEGCEPMNIGLVRREEAKIWTGGSFCKTQYAKEFLKCHLLVIRVLDECKRIGILKDVFDEGGYWETRDLNKLAREVNGMTAMMQKLSSALKKEIPFGVKIESAVDENPTHVTKFEVESLNKLGLFIPNVQN